MSALPVAPTGSHRPDPDPRHRRRLGLVPRPHVRMARLPFLMVLIALVGLGMVGLLLLNTTLQNQAFEATQLRRQVAELSYAEGELEHLLIEAQSAREISRRATALGMRPNRDTAFLTLPGGEVSGEPTVADGSYLPSALTRSAEDIAADKVALAVRRAESRKAAEEKVAEEHRDRIMTARTREVEERRRAAEEAAQANAPAAGQPHAPAAEQGPDAPTQESPAQTTEQPETADTTTAQTEQGQTEQGEDAASPADEDEESR